MTRADFEAHRRRPAREDGPDARERGAAAAVGAAAGRRRAPADTATRAARRRARRSSSTAPSGAARATRPPGTCASKGIPFVEKDVEKDPGAAREMQQKLAKNGLHAGSIPVIDVRGKVMVGFNPQEVDSALGQPL